MHQQERSSRTPRIRRRPPARGLVRIATSLALVVAGATVALASAGSANAETLGPPGSPITYSQVLTRAQDWYDRAPAYSQSTYIWDLGHTREYRTDCSGFIDMALHLKTDATTRDFADPSRSGDFLDMGALNPGNHGDFNYSNVRAGDFFDDTIDGHAFLFAYWGADHKHFTYYNFGGGSSGHAAPEIHYGASFYDSELGYEPTNNYVHYRYARIVAD